MSKQLVDDEVKCAIAFLVSNVSTDDCRVVETKLGPVRGYQRTSLLKNVNFYAFKGIPYAKPPIGELRFKAPEPVEPWSPKILNAFNHSDTCLRSKLVDVDDDTKSEDCLYLNIFVPASATADKKLAVMFWIHGGGYILFSGNEYYFGPDFLMEQNVILVTINFRLGIMGFLSLDTPEYSGNMGLKDQQLALKWTHENIEQFFGDNQRITILGESSGATSTHFHVLSSESRKHFRNAIVLSGTAETLWAFSDQNNHVALANHIAEDLGKPTNSLEDLIQFLKTTPGETLVPYIFIKQSMENRFKFAPVIERKDAKNPFMVASPHEIYKTSNIDRDVIFYHTSNEFLGFVEAFENFVGTWEPEVNITIPMPFNEFNFSTDSEEYRKLSKLVRKYYLNGKLINEETQLEIIDMMNDIEIVYPTYKSIKHHQKNANTFYIRFSVNSTLNALKQTLQCMDKPGATHSDELCYIFRSKLCDQYLNETLQNRENQQSEINLRTIEYITKLFSNFAKYGNPTYKNDLIRGFHSIRSNTINYLDITNEGLKLGMNPRQNAMKFWNRLEKQAQRLYELKMAEISTSDQH